MGLFTHTLAGGGLMLIGAWEVFISSYANLHPSSPSPSPSPTLSPPYRNPTTSQITKPRATNANSFFYFVRFVSIAVFSICFIFDSLISLNDALDNKDRVGFALQLELISVASLFLLYSLFGLLFNFTSLLPLPSSILNLIALFAFGQEFLHFYLTKKDPDGLENQYFDMLLVPISACIFTTLVELGGYKSNLPSLSRGVGLILHGTWLLQMGFSFYTNAMAQGCSLVEKSRGNFTVMCKGHMASHRSKAVVTLQFNGHLALLVITIVGVYSIIANKYGLPGDYSNYKPLNAELQQLDHQAQYTLDSDDELALEENDSQNSNTNTHSVAVEPETKSGINGHGHH